MMMQIDPWVVLYNDWSFWSEKSWYITSNNMTWITTLNNIVVIQAVWKKSMTQTRLIIVKKPVSIRVCRLDSTYAIQPYRQKISKFDLANLANWKLPKFISDKFTYSKLKFPNFIFLSNNAIYTISKTSKLQLANVQFIKNGIFHQVTRLRFC